ncbi:unnamed protein product [Clonostachys byssicola]|uniref:Major facilitator superfamily (MFS) profile domain-containing protein n=1 Tax=Clonostachys byssicola TaxID=160290 RepID=A0A9N9U306_9HYPO|nr:unnamed protein product [Clonostachys byssicola]
MSQMTSPEKKGPGAQDTIDAAPSSELRSPSVTVGETDKYEGDRVAEQFYGSSVTDSYRLKSELVGRCFEDIGMGRYQWELFIICGSGGAIDNLWVMLMFVVYDTESDMSHSWSQGIGAVQPSVALEFSRGPPVTFSSMAYYVGLILGATFWSTSADFIGRKPAFMATLLIGGIFALGAGASHNFITFSALWAVIGTAAGGNVPVDNMIFLEFVPASHQWLLTALSTWWILGQLLVSLIGWGFIANFSCPADGMPGTCRREDNMGWRYTMFTLGAAAVAFSLVRILVFKMPESPRYLLSKKRDAEAVEAVNYVARRNGKPEPLTLAMLNDIDIRLGNMTAGDDSSRVGLTRKQILKENISDFKFSNIRQLFTTRPLIQHTTILWTIWMTIGISYPLYFNFLPTYLAQRFVQDSSLNATYRSYCIQSAVGMAGPALAAALVQTKLGRRYAMAISSVATGAFLFAYTAARTPAANLAFSSVTGMVGNLGKQAITVFLPIFDARPLTSLEYAILFAFTPESFPAPFRGMACGIAAGLLRLGGLFASLIGTYTDFSVVPIYIAGAMWVGVGLMSCVLPFETHDHAAI